MHTLFVIHNTQQLPYHLIVDLYVLVISMHYTAIHVFEIKNFSSYIHYNGW